MSFSTRVKKDILSLKFKDKCCKKAFFHGAIMGAEAFEERITVRFSDSETADLITYIASTVFKIKEMEICEINRGFCNMIQITFSLPTASRLLEDIDGGIDTGEAFDKIFVCSRCVSYFFCGLFCATGSMSEPEKSYRLEFALPNLKRAEKIKELFIQNTTLNPGITQRKKNCAVLFRNAEALQEFLLICQTSALYDFLNQELENQTRAETQRSTNFLASNIQRGVNAGTQQIQAIQKLMDAEKYYLLSEDLRQTAQLRLANPELSLKALASLHNPPITKSGLNHRLDKIIKMAEEI